MKKKTFFVCLLSTLFVSSLLFGGKVFADTKVYRLYHAGRNVHLYTKNESEYRDLPSKGWKQEGVAFMALAEPSKPAPKKPTPPAKPNQPKKPTPPSKPSKPTPPSQSNKPTPPQPKPQEPQNPTPQPQEPQEQPKNEDDINVPNDASDFEISETNGEITITKYVGTRKNVHIPDYINDKPVVAIAESKYTTDEKKESFRNLQLTAVRLPSHLRTIGTNAFDTNRLTSVKLPTTLKEIKISIFANNNLSSVTIPHGTIVIGYSSFADNQITSFTLSSTVKKIDNYAFINNKVEKIDIPKTIESIGELAFGGNPIKNVELPKQFESIGGAAFEPGVTITYR